MKRILHYLPALILTMGIIALNNILKTFSPLWYVWAVLLWLAGFLLNKGQFWGCLLGLIPTVHLVYMSMQYTGQVINIELPLGMVIAVYYIVCGLLTWKRQNTKEKLN